MGTRGYIVFEDSEGNILIALWSQDDSWPCYLGKRIYDFLNKIYYIKNMEGDKLEYDISSQNDFTILLLKEFNDKQIDNYCDIAFIEMEYWISFDYQKINNSSENKIKSPFIINAYRYHKDKLIYDGNVDNFYDFCENDKDSDNDDEASDNDK